MRITTVISDIDGVLLLKDPHWDEDKRWEAYLGLEEGSLAWALNEPDMDKAALLGRISQAEAFQQVSAMLGLYVGQLHPFEKVFWFQYRLNSELALFLQDLRPRSKVALLSNAWSDARNAFNRLFHLDELVDLQIFSAEEGLAKPDERLYLLALERLRVQPEEVIFLDDRPENIHAARKLGFHAHLFQENAQAITTIQHYINS